MNFILKNVIYKLLAKYFSNIDCELSLLDGKLELKKLFFAK
jgi:hypothetical protein